MRQTSLPVCGMMLVALLLACAGRGPISTGPAPLQAPAAGAPGNYPPPLSRVAGKTAVEWGRQMKRPDLDGLHQAGAALQSLKEEGVPYLLEAADTHQADADSLSVCLAYLDGSLVATADLSRVARFLDPRYADFDGTNISPRNGALWALRKAGPRAAAQAPVVRALIGVPKLKVPAEATLREIER